MVYTADVQAAAAEGSEVDSTESLWYNTGAQGEKGDKVLKLTPPSHYGIR